MDNEMYLKHAFQMLSLVLYGVLGALISILPIMVVLWMVFTWNHMSEYSPVLALMFGMTTGLVAKIFSPDFPRESTKPIFYFYLIVMSFLIMYTILFASVPEKIEEVLHNLTAEERKEFRFEEAKAQAYDLQLARDAKTLIQAAGYKCDTVDKANRFAFGGGVSVYCNGFQYSYEIKDVGGRMVVTPT